MESKKIDSKEFPILEFDESRLAIIEATHFIKPKEEFEYCVITFFRDVIEKMRGN
ncbi:hypothetical protein P9847_05565 [Paenibacillus chibensis]|uniref:Uncharacterized protein n=1 Tax=Paenibacillus chibensis TaxID=59846 RepID=A0ABU6PPG8_9BACL|nr:hypothetical protein [Paenibacillus chibensis]